MLMMLPSCNDDVDSSDLLFPTAVVTVCPVADGGFVMQLDDETRLIPNNMKSSPFGDKEVRALVNYTETPIYTGNKNNKKNEFAVRSVDVNWIDSIRTKLPVPTLGAQDDSKYGTDPIEIVQDWVTVAEDGYLTLRIRTHWGLAQTNHVINLVTGTNPEDPFELELRHDANGDMGGQWGDALIAFNLNQLPGAQDGAAKIKLKWRSYTGDKSTEFDLKMRPEPMDVDAQNIRYSAQVK